METFHLNVFVNGSMNLCIEQCSSEPPNYIEIRPEQIEWLHTALLYAARELQDQLDAQEE